MIYLKLYYEFLKIGLFAVGGGLATLPFLYSLGDLTGWFSSIDIANMLAISESTPGPIGINMSTYVGYNVAGYFGGIVATLGLVTPSILIIILISHFLDKFKENKFVNDAFYGIRPASIALIAAAGFSIFINTVLNIELYDVTGLFQDLVNYKNLLLCVMLFGLMKFTKLHPIFFIAIAAILGIVFKL